MTIRHILLAGVAATLLCGTAQAQEGETWNGWYAGAHAGYRWVAADFSSAAYTVPIGGFLVPFPARNESYDADGAIGGLQLGFNRKRAGSNWLWGVEGDFSWGDGDDRRTTNATAVGTPVTVGSTFNYTQVSEVEANWQATLRGRVGIVRGPWLAYATAGVAWIDIDWRDRISGASDAPVTTFAFSHSKGFTMTGVAVGGGVEKELGNPLWRVRLEYLYEDFGDETVPHGATTPGERGELELDAHKLRFAINRKLGRREDPAAYK